MAYDIQNAELVKHLQFFEQQHPKPASVVPNIPQGQQLGTIDKLAQSVVPRIVDKLNEANWKIDWLTALCEQQQAALQDLYRWVNEVGNPSFQMHEDRIVALEKAGAPKKETKVRRKKKEESEVDLMEIADYDPDTDTWKPMTVDGKQITGALLDMVQHLGSEAHQMYSDELLDFISSLDDRVKAAITKKFPR